MLSFLEHIVGANFGVKTIAYLPQLRVIFRRVFDENNFALAPVICARSGSMRFLYSGHKGKNVRTFHLFV